MKNGFVMKPFFVICYINRSNRSFSTLQIGHTAGGSLRAQIYPQTLHLHTGYDN
jgi:hypothetical protein